eukprot:365574-Chlamydomonas_euryale.AAC.24
MQPYQDAGSMKGVGPHRACAVPCLPAAWAPSLMLRQSAVGMHSVVLACSLHGPCMGTGLRMQQAVEGVFGRCMRTSSLHGIRKDVERRMQQAVEGVFGRCMRTSSLHGIGEDAGRLMQQPVEGDAERRMQQAVEGVFGRCMRTSSLHGIGEDAGRLMQQAVEGVFGRCMRTSHCMGCESTQHLLKPGRPADPLSLRHAGELPGRRAVAASATGSWCEQVSAGTARRGAQRQILCWFSMSVLRLPGGASNMPRVETGWLGFA